MCSSLQLAALVYGFLQTGQCSALRRLTSSSIRLYKAAEPSLTYSNDGEKRLLSSPDSVCVDRKSKE